MRASKLFFRTFKQPPADADIPSHQLLEQAGYIHRLSRGIYSYSPLMQRVLEKLTALVDEEMTKAGAQRFTLPLLHPKELWDETERWDAYSSERLLYKTEDREGHHYCFAPTHEEAAADFVRAWVKSYRELPLTLYQIGEKFRDEIRPRFGLIRAKEFLMKDGYSYGSNPHEMEEQYLAMRQAYCAIFDRLGLDYVIVSAHGGKIAKSGKSEEFQVKTAVGEDAVMICGDFAANVEATSSLPPPFDYDLEKKKSEEVETPGVTSIEALSSFLNIPPQMILKCVVIKLLFLDRKEFVSVGIRGDREVNLLKVADHFGAEEALPASDHEIEQKGGIVGVLGPFDSPFPFVADRSCEPMCNFCCGANKRDLHLIHANWESPPDCHDFLLSEAGDQLPEGGELSIQRGTEVGHIFCQGTQYSEKMNIVFQDEEGATKPIWMGTYGLGMGRTAQACVEQMHDEKGIVWPLLIAPFKIAIIPAATNNEEMMTAATSLYEELMPFSPLFDDRPQRLGFKLKDCDLMGVPYKLIIGKGYLESGKLEIESRQGEKSTLAREELLPWAEETLLPS